MLKLLTRFKPIDWLIILFLIAIVLLQVWFALEIPRYAGQIMSELLENPNPATGEVLRIGLKMLGVALGSMACIIIVGLIATFLAAKFSRILRSDLFSKVQSYSFSEINKFSTPSLITRSTNDIQQVQMSVMMIFQMAISAPITAVWALIRIQTASRELTLVTAFGVGILVIALTLIFLCVIPRFKRIQELTDKLNGVTRENISGLRVVKAYNADQYAENKFEAVNEAVAYNNLFVNRIMGLMNPFMILILHGIVLAIYWLGAHLINDGILVFPQITVFVGLAMQVLFSFIMMTILFIMIPRASVSAKRINEVLKTDSSVKDKENTINPETNLGEVEFKNVSFKYPQAEDYVLKNISFKALPGQTVAIVGSTGSGKSSLINLVPRFYDVSEGSILVDGIDIKDYKQIELRQKIGYVPQKGILFSGTINQNIDYGNKEINQEMIQKASEIALADEFIQNMEDKYQAKIAQGGTNVSGGQRQRLSIARAVAIEPEIFIFDDSFSALDYKTDREVRNNLKKLSKQATSLIVAQRIGTIIDADLIIVLEQGELVGAGKHQDLLASCSVYREIALSQLSKKELGIDE
ncbi:MAG: ABC transporter ATP-binding protein/permease [Erysipelotrichales bacterium]|nr:ABC transporter ATP-binding protein/permease [Erysipelotrichales bacterium]